jgi:hypothetical protein
MLYLQHSQAELTKGSDSNSACSLLQNQPKDWSSYWFYVKVDMSKIPCYTGPAYPLYSPIEAVTATCTASYNHRAVGFKNCENAFFLASTTLGGRDVIEEFVTHGSLADIPWLGTY